MHTEHYLMEKISFLINLIAFDLVDGQVDDLEAMCEVLEAVAAAGRKELEANT